MQSRRLIQIGLSIAIIGVIAFVFLSGKTNSSALVVAKSPSKGSEKEKAGAPPGFNFELLEKDVIAKLEKPEADKIMVMKGRLNGRGAMNENLLVIAEEFQRLKQPAIAGYYFEKLTHLEPNSEKVWFGMGKNFFDAEQTVDAQPVFNYFVQLSYTALQKVLEMHPKGNLEAMTDQAVNILESNSQSPMQGVGLLREVIQLDSNNRKALNYLGLFSMQSGQYDKAIQRFEHLVKLGPGDDPNYPYYYRSLGQAYAGANKKEEAVKAFTTYKSLVTEESLKQEADKLIGSVNK